jgi:DNA-binding MarR family transcriptional regulator
VTRTVDPHDARAVLIRITDEGVRTLSQVRRDRAAAIDPQLARLAPEARRTLAGAVEVLRGLLADAAPALPAGR